MSVSRAGAHVDLEGLQSSPLATHVWFGGMGGNLAGSFAGGGRVWAILTILEH
jgi:hypothetical protein